jgi:hypothetical protein
MDKIINDPTGTHRYAVQKAIAVCAAFVDKRFDPSKTPAINTDELIADVCKHFGITGRDFQAVYEMREGYVENPGFMEASQ